MFRSPGLSCNPVPLLHQSGVLKLLELPSQVQWGFQVKQPVYDGQWAAYILQSKFQGSPLASGTLLRFPHLALTTTL